MAFYAKCCQARFTYKALHDLWSHFIFGLWQISLAEYLHVLSVYSHLLQIIPSITATVRTASIPLWMRSRPGQGASIIYLIYDAFVGCDHRLASIWTIVWDVGLKTTLLPLLRYLNLVCNNFNYTWMYGNVFVNSM